MAYSRKISYFDLIEFGEKRSGGGFCKWEQKEGVHTLSVSVCGLFDITNGLAKVFTRGGNELGEVSIKEGRFSVTFQKKVSDGNFEWEFSRIRIPLADDKELVAEFETDAMEKRQGEINVDKIEEIYPILEEKIEEKVELEPEQELQKESPLYSLWDCIAQSHELIHPFGTETEYCKIGLEDILLLKEKYHILRKNQFLFHGYYNYQYLILGRKDEDSEEYWLGVPGIYHEREKMAARMYGFEKFEGRTPKYRVGDLGYYLISVE